MSNAVDWNAAAGVYELNPRIFNAWGMSWIAFS
jgi:hypothetical protein